MSIEVSNRGEQLGSLCFRAIKSQQDQADGNLATQGHPRACRTGAVEEAQRANEVAGCADRHELAERADAIQRERALLDVAASRARDVVVISKPLILP